MVVQSTDRKLYVAIAEQIRSWIESGDLCPGDKLPPLAELAEQFGCSRATVREALGALRGQGLVEFRHGDGTYVRTASIDMWMEPLDAALLLAPSHASQLLELTAAILAGVAGVAAERCSDSGLSELSKALFRLECAEPGAEDAVLAELGFYLTLAECTGNVLLENVVRVLQEALRSQLRFMQPERPLGTDVCRQLFDAVAAGDVERARSIAYEFGDEMSAAILQKRSRLRQLDREEYSRL
ncbi:FadR/GntR family transcriptional regulator [Alicyclobacillus pomorum]|jgi:GntR family transcriptional regulator, transcriptional repressor for pyruvate dehydrogenase complex|uniref:FadR/GntR family transcriptional regulator n=1 Tax=Alicyclobacillus pomorum TaxID=204470 RepID=UPI00041141CF|nr:GntR family transcriptional regulator [Alicyclobacillus pomorum]